MKMAKPTDHDINLALDIARIVEDLEQRYRPALVFGEEDQELWLDMVRNGHVKPFNA